METLLAQLPFHSLEDYRKICQTFLSSLDAFRRIQSSTHPQYIFYQDKNTQYITRPLNTTLFIESITSFELAYQQFLLLLADLRHRNIINHAEVVNPVIYTLQQSIGCISDSLPNTNQARKRVGQLFEQLIRLVIQQVGVVCEARTVRIPIPGYSGYFMPYELDLVLSLRRETSEKQFIYSHEIVGSIKTTSKDRLDKIFLDKFLLSRLLGRDVPVIAIFLHDVQRAQRGADIFSINSTFKTNHFLGYTVALNRLDGVYYVDPRPEMLVNERLREQISDFRQFLIRDLWELGQHP